MLNVPVLFIVFNRPETTRRVFEKIREIKPVQLFIAADGPRRGSSRDIVLCNEVRSIVSQVDWPARIFALYRDKNLGCKLSVSGAINWFFEHVHEGIILEDDCLPNLDFFYFCQAMLGAYRNHPQIVHIGGTNFQDGRARGSANHYFSKYHHVWGWATWSRAWKHYDVSMNNFDVAAIVEANNTWFFNEEEKDYWVKKFLKIKTDSDAIDCWDFQWTFACWLNQGIAIIPQVNLVENIGIGSGTHTIVMLKHLIKETGVLPPNNFKPEIKIDREADYYTFERIIKYKGSILSRILYRLKKWMKKPSKSDLC